MASTASDLFVERLMDWGVDTVFGLPGDVGCCGLAGSFGCEAGADALIVTDGFSCRSQIEHGSDRQALHLAQVLSRDGGSNHHR